LTHSKGGKMIFLTTLPRIPDHPFIVDTMAKAEMNDVLFSFTIDDNQQLSQEQYDACVRRAGGKHTIDFRREYLNEIVRDPSIVALPEFNSKVHVGPITIPPFCHYWVTGDWGGTQDMTVVLLMTHDFLVDVDYVLAEGYWPPNTEIKKILPTLQGWEEKHPRARFLDCPGAIQIELCNEYGYQITAPIKDDWQANINLLNVRFAENKIRIDPSCRLLIQTCQSGILTKNRKDFEQTQALGHCDAIAALIYGVRSYIRQNPWPSGQMSSTQWHIPLRGPAAEETMAASIIPEQAFAMRGIKRFGTFKR